ncbi:endonuclease domain-containing protein [Plantibacter sp. Mn2098]|uniref:endonuclease domain-containing protein n=1 Tax=Plantibacter sp. Mn2098 TaxID=3395266 RepID=UPI003BC0342B
MTRRPEFPEPLDREPFSIGDAGLSASRLRASDLTRPFHGVRAAQGYADGVIARCLAYSTRMPAGAFFSHGTAARIWGLPVPRRFDAAPLDVSVVSPMRAPRGRGIRGHKLDGSHWRRLEHHGLVVSHPVDAWSQLGMHLNELELVMVADGITRRVDPLGTQHDLLVGLARMGRRRGVNRLRAAYERVRPGTDSPKETELRLAIVDDGLPEPKVNHPIFDVQGTFLALGDLVYPKYRTLVEYDGGTHFLDEGQIFHDIDRLDAVMAEGWRVIRVNRSHLHSSPAHILSTIRQSLRSHGWRPD